MQKTIQHLIERKKAFQPFNNEPATLFLYIAPADEKEREKFLSIIIKPLLISVPRHHILRDDQKVMSVLLDNFPQDTILDIFISTKDSNAPIVLEQSLNEYIREQKIVFEY